MSDDPKIVPFPKPQFIRKEEADWTDFEDMLCKVADEITTKSTGMVGTVVGCAVILTDDAGNMAVRRWGIPPDELVDLASEYEWECFRRENPNAK